MQLSLKECQYKMHRNNTKLAAIHNRSKLPNQKLFKQAVKFFQIRYVVTIFSKMHSKANIFYNYISKEHDILLQFKGNGFKPQNLKWKHYLLMTSNELLFRKPNVNNEILSDFTNELIIMQHQRNTKIIFAAHKTT